MVSRLQEAGYEAVFAGGCVRDRLLGLVPADHDIATSARPEEVEEFVKQTGVDSLAISIGTSHGAFKFKVKPGEEPPPLVGDAGEPVEVLLRRLQRRVLRVCRSRRRRFIATSQARRKWLRG